jgi:hypothetical protein
MIAAWVKFQSLAETPGAISGILAAHHISGLDVVTYSFLAFLLLWLFRIAATSIRGARKSRLAVMRTR